MRALPIFAVLVAQVLPAQTRKGLPGRIHHALERARAPLLSFLQTEIVPGRLALLCLAALHDGVPHDDPVLEDAVQRLAAARPTGTYELAIRLMVMAEMEEYPHRRRAARHDLAALLRNRRAGGFGYGARRANRWDLSNTQYGALGLRAAASLGLEIPKKVWRDLLRTVKSSQLANGSFGYVAKNRSGYASMTVAGIAVLQLCLQYLDAKSAHPTKVGKRLQRGWKWLGKHKSRIGDPKTSWSLYFHYGLERAAVLSGVDRIGGKGWYEAGAKMLLELQTARGDWGGGIGVAHLRGHAPISGDPIGTAFAILFLRRKFKRYARNVPITGAKAAGATQLSPEASAKEIARAVSIELSRGFRAVPDLLKCLRSSVTAQRRAAALALLKISGKDFGYEPYRKLEESAEAIKAAERWWLRIGHRKR